MSHTTRLISCPINVVPADIDQTTEKLGLDPQTKASVLALPIESVPMIERYEARSQGRLGPLGRWQRCSRDAKSA